MKRTRLLVLLIAVLASTFTFAQQPILRHYTVDEGLPSSETYFALQDRSGYIWVATDRGVSRFDGKNYQTFTTEDGLVDNTIFRLYEDHHGRIWMIGFTGQVCYYENGHFHPYRYNHLLAAEFNGAVLIRDLQIDENETHYFSSITHGLVTITKDGKVKVYAKIHVNRNEVCYQVNLDLPVPMLFGGGFISSNHIPGHFPDNVKLECTLDDSIYTHSFENANETFGNGHNILSGERVAKHGMIIGWGTALLEVNGERLLNVKMKHKIISITPVINGHFWIGLRNGGAMQFRFPFDASSKPELTVLDGASVSHVLVDDRGGTWFTTLEDGVYYMGSAEALAFTVGSGPKGGWVQGIAGDAQGNIWIGCNDGGMYRIHNDLSLTKVDHDPIFEESQSITTIYSDPRDGSVWIGRSGEVNRGDLHIDTAGNIHVFETSNALDFCVDTVEGITYSSMPRTVAIIMNDTVLQELSPIAVRFRGLAVCMYEGKWLVGTMRGVMEFVDGKFQPFAPEIEALRQRVQDIQVLHDGSILFSVLGIGLLNYDGTVVQRLTKADGLCSNSINRLFLDKKGRIWACTYEGLNCIEKNSDQPWHIKRYTVADGLPSNEVTSVFVTKNKVFAGTKKGVAVFPLFSNHLAQNASRIHISKVEINRRDTVIQEAYDLPYNQNYLSFHFIALSYNNPNAIEYQYRLLGLEEVWSTTTSNAVSYTTLPPGSYTFELRYADSARGHSPVTSISINIRTPFWNRWWFWSMLACVGFAVVYLIFRLRIRLLKRDNLVQQKLVELESKALRAQMNPHFIFNALAAIQGLVSQNETEKAERFIARFASLVRKVLENSRTSTVTFAAELELIQLYLKMQQLRFGRKLDFTIESNRLETDTSLHIPPMMIQPFVENAILHGIRPLRGNGLVELTFEIWTEQVMRCVVKDNGVGRGSADKSSGQQSTRHRPLASLISKERLELMNLERKQDFRVVSHDLYDEDGNTVGLKVELFIPLTRKSKEDDTLG